MPVFNAVAVLEERLIKMVDIERIRYAHFREGSSIRELARALHHSRTTIRRRSRKLPTLDHRNSPGEHPGGADVSLAV